MGGGSHEISRKKQEKGNLATKGSKIAAKKCKFVPKSKELAKKNAKKDIY